MAENRNVTLKLPKGRHNDLINLQKYYSDLVGIKLSQSQVMQKLIFNAVDKMNEEKLRKAKEEEM